MRSVADEADMQLAEQSGLGMKIPNKNWVRFYKKPVQDPARTKVEGRPIFEMVEYVEIIVPGDQHNKVNKPVNDKIRNEYPAQYQAFLQDKSQDEASGTLLTAWGGVDPARAEELFHGFKIRTVEQLAAVPDGNLQNLGLGSRRERDKARDYVETMKGAAPVAKLRDELEAQRSRADSLEEQLKELSAKFESMHNAKPHKEKQPKG